MQEWVDDLNANYAKKREEQKKKIEEEKEKVRAAELLEEERKRGIPVIAFHFSADHQVTRETFLVWNAKFMKELEEQNKAMLAQVVVTNSNEPKKLNGGKLLSRY